MTFRSFLAASALSGFSALISAGLIGSVNAAEDDDGDAFFQEFLGEIEKDEDDRERCANTRDEVSPTEQYEACTRLIEDAHLENDLVGTYYVNRATAPKDPESQCADVTKGVAIIEKSKSTIFGANYLQAAKRLKEVACE